MNDIETELECGACGKRTPLVKLPKSFRWALAGALLDLVYAEEEEKRKPDPRRPAEGDESPCPPAEVPSFRDRLTHLINSACQENGSNTPDFILADFVADCLELMHTTIRRRDEWYGRYPDDEVFEPEPEPKEGEKPDISDSTMESIKAHLADFSSIDWDLIETPPEKWTDQTWWDALCRLRQQGLENAARGGLGDAMGRVKASELHDRLLRGPQPFIDSKHPDSLLSIEGAPRLPIEEFAEGFRIAGMGRDLRIVGFGQTGEDAKTWTALRSVSCLEHNPARNMWCRVWLGNQPDPDRWYAFRFNTRLLTPAEVFTKPDQGCVMMNADHRGAFTRPA